MGDDGAGHQPGPLREKGDQVLDVQPMVLAHPPPGNPRARLRQLQPGGDVGVVVEVGHYDLVARSGEGLAERQADQADEAGGVHAEGHFAGIVGSQERRDPLPRCGDDPVHLHTLGIGPAALDVEVEQMRRHPLQHLARRLGAGGVVEIDERRGAGEGREPAAHGLDREGHGAGWERQGRGGGFGSWRGRRHSSLSHRLRDGATPGVAPSHLAARCAGGDSGEDERGVARLTVFAILCLAGQATRDVGP